MINLSVERWDDGLALRLPKELLDTLGWREGATVTAELTADGALCLRATAWSRQAFADELAAAQATMSVSPPVVRAMRDDARY